MIELLISLLLSLGINFSQDADGKISLTSADYSRLASAPSAAGNDDSEASVSYDEIVISDGIDPNSHN